jgi:ketosteroid isomerase-like protein
MHMKSALSCLALLGAVILMTTGCNETIRYDQYKKELIEVDIEFAKHSVAEGSHSAFLNFIDDSCVLLRPKRMPVIGRDKIQEMFSTPDTSFTLNWKPMYADVAKSGDLGYTYGIYTVEMDSPEGNAVTKQGTYVTVWKRNEKGEWKFVLDTGNQGLGTNNEESSHK